MDEKERDPVQSGETADVLPEESASPDVTEQKGETDGGETLTEDNGESSGEDSKQDGEDSKQDGEDSEQDGEDAARPDEYYDEDSEYDDDYDDEEIINKQLSVKEERRKKKRKKKAHGRLAFALIMVTLVISVAVLGAVTVINISSEILGLSRSDSQFSVEIPENSGTEAIADILEQEGIIGNTTLFRIVSKLKGADGTYMAGSHKLNPNMSYGDIIEVLQQEPINPREFVNLTFPEGIRLIDAAAKLEENGVCNAADFIRVFNSTTFGFDFEEKVIVSPKKFYKMEGYLFPDTYQFYLDEDPVNVAKKVCKNFEYKITPDMYGRMEDLGMTLEETLTLASIVQREAGDVYNMKMVSSVFHNRLNNPDEYPLLQSDPTSGYVREVIVPNLEIYSESMCEAYDTYKGGGLPPGPICNPGTDAIEAVLYPRDTDYFFFCSDLETEEFFYGRTYAEHQQNLIDAHLV